MYYENKYVYIYIYQLDQLNYTLFYIGNRYLFKNNNLSSVASIYLFY